MFNFRSHDEVPFVIRNYVMTIVNVETFAELDINEMNDFLNLQEPDNMPTYIMNENQKDNNAAR